MEIKYTLKSDDKEDATIEINNITVSTIEYNSESISNIVKNITVQKDIQNTKELSEIIINKNPNKTTYTEGEKVNNEGLVVIAKYNDGTSSEIKNYKYSPTEELKVSDKKVEISYTENSITKTVSYDITVKEEKAPKEEDTKDEQKEDIKDTNKKDDTTVGGNNKLPQTGITHMTVIAIAVLGFIIVISYVSYRKVKDI